MHSEDKFLSKAFETKSIVIRQIDGLTLCEKII